MISIIIPVYNQAQKLILTLKSLALQTYSDYEVIIVNDGSTDNVEAIFSAYSQTITSNQRYVFLNQVNRGAPAARNRGWQEAQGEFFIFCDADAYLKPEALDTMLKELGNHPEVSYAYSSFYWGKKLFRCGPFSSERLRKEPFIHAMALIRREDFPANGWDESLKKFQDWDLWLTMLSLGKIGYFIPQVLFTISTGGVMSSWLPSFAYKLLPFLPTVKKYKAAKAVIFKKHGLN